MAAPVKINFRVLGVDEVVNAFKTVAKATRDAEKQVEILSTRRERAIRQTASSTRKSEESIRKEHEKTADKAIKEAQRELKERYKFRNQRAKDAAASARIEENIANRTADKAIQEARRELKERYRIRSQNAKDRDRDAKADERLEKRNADKKVAESKRVAAEKARQDKYLLGIRQRHFLSEQRQEERNSRLAEAKARIADRQRAAARGERASAIVGSVGGMLSSAVSMAGTALSLGGGFTIADAVSEDVKARGQAKALELMSGGEASAADIVGASKAAGTKFGMASTDVIEALDAFAQKSGKVKDGLSMLKDLVEVATATGADLGELSRTAGIVHMTTGNSADTMSVVREMAGMGRAGSVDLRDLQQYGGRVTSAASLYENKRAAITGLNAIVQQSAATGGSTDAAEATMSVVRLGSDLLKKEDVLKSDYGMNIRGKDGKLLRDPTELIKELVVKTGGDMGKLHEILGERSFRAASGYAAVFNDATKGKTGKEAETVGVAAMNEAFDRFKNAALSEEQVKKDASARMQETDKQLAVVLQQLRHEVGDRLTPKFIELVPHLTRLVPTIASSVDAMVAFIDFIRNNPFTGLGALVSGKIAADLAAAGITKAAEAALAGSLGAVGAIAIPVMTAVIGKAIIDIQSAAVAKAQRDEAMAAATSGQLPADVTERLRTGKATPEDAAMIESQRASVRQRILALQDKADNVPLATAVGSAIVPSIKDADRSERDAMKREVEAYYIGLGELAKAASDAARQIRDSQPNRSKPFGAGQ